MDRVVYPVGPVKLHLLYKVGGKRQRGQGFGDGILFVAKAIIGAGFQRTDECFLFVRIGIGPGAVQYSQGCMQVFVPGLDLSSLRIRKTPEIFTSEDKGKSLDVIEVEQVVAGSGSIGFGDSPDAVVGCLAQCAYVPLQAGYVCIGIKDAGNVEHLTAPGVIVVVVVGKNFHEFTIVPYRLGKRTVCPIYPSLHGVG